MLRGYYKPHNLDEALRILNDNKGSARIVAGATDIFLDIEHRRKDIAYLVDIRGIPEMKEIYKKDNKIFIGAAVTHSQIVCDEIIREKYTALAAAASALGSPQVRNIGTIGGNIMNAQPAADLAMPLFCFDAVAEIIVDQGEVLHKPIGDMYISPGVSSFDSTKCVLKGFYLPDDYYTVSTFSRFAKRNALCLPMLNLAVAMRIQEGSIEDVRIAAGPISTTPMRLVSSESILKGKKPDGKLLMDAAEAAEKCATPRDSFLRGSSAYRKELLRTLLYRALSKCCD